ncbi:hypothetical protein [Nocardia wallacei]|uniref:hypothetical protein n=1 Tax=Nocardia wallacei TaxID=480035 RepID=UPI002453FBC7|nr:hypothetical protein [Nocardia wallacei]
MSAPTDPPVAPLNVLVWHVLGPWAPYLVQGPHRDVVPPLPAEVGGGLYLHRAVALGGPIT